MKLFAEHILAGDYLDQRHDEALPDQQPLPRPELKMVQRPIGPIAVFGASNFPLAFSVAGGDTAAAFAAGCPVIVKGHEAHPGTGEIVADAINAAMQHCNIEPGVFSFIQGGSREVGVSLVQHPLIRAVGFTGSLSGGRALFDICASRPEPIPFFGELGSINPIFVLESALGNRAETIADEWAGSLAMGAGQFCTNPGVVVVSSGKAAERFIATARAALQSVPEQAMLTKEIATAYVIGQHRIADTEGTETLVMSSSGTRNVLPNLFRTTARNWVNNNELSEEVFGPLGIVVVAENFDEQVEVAKSLEGQLTCTIHFENGDTEDALKLLPVLERKAGRVLANGFPTGVEVCDSMVHGGPYPASTNFGHTSVGTLSIRRFLRPVSYQNIPDALLPND